MKYESITIEEYLKRMKQSDFHIANYSRCEALFRENKDNSDVGVNVDLDIENFLNKTGNELIDDISLKERLYSFRSVTTHNVLDKPTKEYELSEWLVCLDEKLFIDCAIVMISKVIAVDSYAVDHRNIPLICYIVSAYELYDFEHKKEWHTYFSDIVKSVLSDERLHTLDAKWISLLSEFS